MHKSLPRLLSVAIIIALAASLQPSDISAQRPECRSFPETGKQVCGMFLTYWRDHGGLPQQGFPISNEFKEQSSIDGKVYTVQYFERAVFELHPENQEPYTVLLSLLGTMRYKEKYPKGAQELPPDAGAQAGRYFPETGKEIKGEFLQYWEKNGGLAQQGYPITNRMMEKSDLDGKEYIVQYFERAVFELHTENQPPNDVLLSQLGTFQYKKKYPNGEPRPTNIALGPWGGEHIAIVTQETGATIEYDCGRGTIDEPVVVDDNGRFKVMGTHTFERGGPIRQDEPPDTHPALYTGTVGDSTITLTVVTTDENRTIGTFTASLGKQARLVKCL